MAHWGPESGSIRGEALRVAILGGASEEMYTKRHPLLKLLVRDQPKRTFWQEWRGRLVNAWGALKGEREEYC